MKIIAIDMSSEACSAALYVETEGQGNEISERFEIAPGAHSQQILPMVESLLGEAGMVLSQLDAIAFGRGPGSFTGLRVAAGVTQGIAFGADLPVVSVSTLAALAQGAWETLRQDHVLSALDARMDEVYWGAFKLDTKGIMLLVGDEIVCSPANVPTPDFGQWHGVGSGWDRYSEEFLSRLKEKVQDWEQAAYPRARYIALLANHYYKNGNIISPEQAIPIYLRDNVAKKARKNNS